MEEVIGYICILFVLRLAATRNFSGCKIEKILVV